MADNVAITAGTGTTVSTEEITTLNGGGVSAQHVQRVVPAFRTADGVAVDMVPGAGTAAAAMRSTLASDDPLVAGALAGLVECSVDITRPNDTTTYAVGDAWADTTPAVGGQTFSSVVRASGKSCLLTDLLIASSNPAATPLVGEIWIFNASVTAVADNAALAVSDAGIKTLRAIVPFSMVVGVNNNSVHVRNLNIALLTSGSADLRFLVKVNNAYVPVANEVLTVIAKFQGMN